LWRRCCQHCGEYLPLPTNSRARFCPGGDCLKADKREKIAAQRAKKKPKIPSPEFAITVSLRGTEVGVRTPRDLQNLLIAFPELKDQVAPKKLARAAGR
jgi:hypothetical protein